MQQIIDMHIPIILLIALTLFLVYRDCSMNLKYKAEFCISLLAVLFLKAINAVLTPEQFQNTADFRMQYNTFRAIVYPLIALMGVFIALKSREMRVRRILFVPVIINAVVCCAVFFSFMRHPEKLADSWYHTPGFLFSAAVFFVYSFLIFVIEMVNTGIREMLERIIVLMVAAAVFSACLLEHFFQSRYTVDSVVAVGICVYYYYLVMQIYKKDALTGLLNRHSMRLDLQKMKRKRYVICVIDIDNFKMINDKYGHRKGDEVLVTVVRTVERYLPKNSRFYRYGGDEFAVIARALSCEELERILEQVNEELAGNDYRISYGVVEHPAGADDEETFIAADTVMYENKRLLKSEDIWDDMTGLYNLRGFLDEMEIIKSQAIREQKDICLVSIDIERLSSINMGYGYSEGNMIITSIAGIIKSSLDMQEFAGHLGSDEFIVALKVEKGDEEYAKTFIDKVKVGVRNCANFDGKEYTVGITAIAELTHPQEEIQMEERVNLVMVHKQDFKANRKKAGFVYDDYEEFDKDEEKMALEIIKNNQLKYHFQPIVSAKDGVIVAYEALMRSDTEPALSPLTILRYAAKNHVGYEVEKLTFRNVLKRVSEDRTIPQNAKIFVNSIPGETLLDEDYEAIHQEFADLFPRLVVEITEQSELDDDALALIKERQERDGFELAIDDFGSGNSNTYSLLRYRPECIKLDRLLVSDIDRNTKKQYFVNSIIMFAKENGMSVLAEGVETEAELKMMIRLQVDYIQGYYTAKPAGTIIREISEERKREIVSENIRGVVEGKRKIYIASSGWELSLVQLALQEYTGITVSLPNLMLVGNGDYTADMCIKIKDGLECCMTLRDVHLNSIDDLPCIDIGEGAQLTLMLEGNCSLNYKGIHVPEGSSLTIKGTGNLAISTKGHYSYGIGSARDEAIGSIVFNHSGMLKIRVDGDECVAIGGGKYATGRGIAAESGKFDIAVAGVSAVGIGCLYGDVPIHLCGFWANLEFRVNNGSAIGSLHGNQNVVIESFTLLLKGSGTRLSGIGSNQSSGGTVRIDSGELDISMNGQVLNLIGIRSGKLSISTANTRLHIKGEGNEVLGFGSRDRQSVVRLSETTTEVIINSAEAMPFGVESGAVYVSGIKPVLYINGSETEI